MRAFQTRRFIIAGVACHSLALGFAMLLWPAQTLDLLGWEYAGPAFFSRQSGIFLLILGGAYVVAIWNRRFAWFLVASKAAATVFLIAEHQLDSAPGIVLLVAFFDGLMGLAVAAALGWEMLSPPVIRLQGPGAQTE